MDEFEKDYNIWVNPDKKFADTVDPSMMKICEILDGRNLLSKDFIPSDTDSTNHKIHIVSTNHLTTKWSKHSITIDLPCYKYKENGKRPSWIDNKEIIRKHHCITKSMCRKYLKCYMTIKSNWHKKYL